MYKIEDIKTIHLEVTQRCQASCPMCDRNMNGEGINPHINLDELSLADVKLIFKPDFIKQLRSMYMCGNLGDPIVAQDTLEIFKYFRENNPKIWLSMNTNAGARDEEWWTELASIFGTMGAVIFSVDGLEDTNHIYRQGVNWKAVERSMDAFTKAGGRARWDFLIFEHNEHQVEEARAIAKQKGFESFRPKKSARFMSAKATKKDSHQAKDKKGNNSAVITEPKQETNKNKELSKIDLIAEKFGSLDAFYDVSEIDCKVKSEGNLYVSAEGLALPCCWTAGRMYKWWFKDPKEDQIWDFIEATGGKEALNAKNGLEKVFENGFFKRIEDSWKVKGCINGKARVCAMKCSKEFDIVEAQYQ